MRDLDNDVMLWYLSQSVKLKLLSFKSTENERDRERHLHTLIVREVESGSVADEHRDCDLCWCEVHHHLSKVKKGMLKKLSRLPLGV